MRYHCRLPGLHIFTSGVNLSDEVWWRIAMKLFGFGPFNAFSR